MPTSSRPTHLIIGGTIKGATSSVFTYLSAHPDVCASSIKETLFFTHRCTHDVERDRALYLRYFKRAETASVLLEASPNYLAYIENVAPYMHAVLPDAKLLFILRDPVVRTYSHFNFAKSKLELPEAMDFDRYMDLCEAHSSHQLDADAAGIPLKHLRALEIGKYSEFLRFYYDAFGPEQVAVKFYDALQRDTQNFMREVCRFVGLDPGFYAGYVFHRSNVTFGARRRGFHGLALKANRTLEAVLRRHPALKRGLTTAYKALNQERRGYPQMSAASAARLRSYFASSNAELRELVDGQDLPKWLV